MLSEFVMVRPVAVMGGPRLLQVPEDRSPVYCNWYCWPGTAVQVKRMRPDSVCIGGRNDGLGNVTVKTATALVMLPYELVMTTS